MTPRAAPSSPPEAGAARHLRAVLLLPVMNTVVVPALVFGATHGSATFRLGRPESFAVLLLGLAMLTAGVALVAHSIALMVRIGHGTLAPWDPTRHLIVTGAYRYSRNPMKAGLFLVLLAEAVLLRSVPLFVWFAAFAIANLLYIPLFEEPGLRRRFGLAYEEYAARVPRWLPRIAARGDRAEKPA